MRQPAAKSQSGTLWSTPQAGAALLRRRIAAAAICGQATQRSRRFAVWAKASECSLHRTFLLKTSSKVQYTKFSTHRTGMPQPATPRRRRPTPTAPKVCPLLLHTTLAQRLQTGSSPPTLAVATTGPTAHDPRSLPTAPAGAHGWLYADSSHKERRDTWTCQPGYPSHSIRTAVRS